MEEKICFSLIVNVCHLIIKLKCLQNNSLNNQKDYHSTKGRERSIIKLSYLIYVSETRFPFAHK